MSPSTKNYFRKKKNPKVFSITLTHNSHPYASHPQLQPHVNQTCQYYYLLQEVPVHVSQSFLLFNISWCKLLIRIFRILTNDAFIK